MNGLNFPETLRLNSPKPDLKIEANGESIKDKKEYLIVVKSTTHQESHKCFHISETNSLNGHQECRRSDNYQRKSKKEQARHPSPLKTQEHLQILTMHSIKQKPYRLHSTCLGIVNILKQFLG